MDVIFQTTFCQRYVFAEPPAPHIRNMLIGAGFKFDGTCWHRTMGTASALTPSEARQFISQDYKDYSDSGIAPRVAI